VWAAPAAGQDTRLREVLYHIHMVQQAFLSVWLGEPIAARSVAEFESLAAIEAWGRAAYPGIHAHIATLTDDRLGQVQVLPWAHLLQSALGRVPAATTLGDTVLQVASHSTYHRGQVNVKLREIGGEPPLVDYIAWGWFGRPAPAWPDPVQPGARR
jgi:uncharacterized damage-inducible protein DinB